MDYAPFSSFSSLILLTSEYPVTARLVVSREIGNNFASFFIFHFFGNHTMIYKKLKESFMFLQTEAYR